MVPRPEGERTTETAGKQPQIVRRRGATQHPRTLIALHRRIRAWHRRNRRCRRTEAAERGPRSGDPVEEVGTVPQRAAMGHSPRGLQPGRQRVGLLLPRSVPLARLPLGRRRTRRNQRRQAAAVLCRSRSGTSGTRSSRNACSASPTARATTARTSRSTTSTSTAPPPTRT